jgi:hypothetical protein
VSTTTSNAIDRNRFEQGPIVLSGYQLQAALGFLAPDGTAEQMEQQVCLAERDNVRDEDDAMTALPPGPFVWLAEYPEEGLMPLDGLPDQNSFSLLATGPDVVQSVEGTTACCCRWRGDMQVLQCKLHNAHVDAIHEWAEKARRAEAKLVVATTQRDQLTEAIRQAICKLPRYSFLLHRGGVTRVHDASGRWAELDEAAALLEPERVDAFARGLGLPSTDISNAARDVLAERQRQVIEEGLTTEHDDRHDVGELAAAAAAYALAAADDLHPMSQGDGSFGPGGQPPSMWPWAPHWWKPSEDPRRMLVKAVALGLAQIEQIDRSKAR